MKRVSGARFSRECVHSVARGSHAHAHLVHLHLQPNGSVPIALGGNAVYYGLYLSVRDDRGLCDLPARPAGAWPVMFDSPHSGHHIAVLLPPPLLPRP